MRASWGRRGRTGTGSELKAARRRPFDAAGGVRQSAATPSPWNDEAKAAEYMGGYAPWQAFLDPGGRSALVATCFRGTQCTLDMVVDGQPVQRVRDPGTAPDQSTLFGKPTGAVRVGESWFFVTTTTVSPFEITGWRSDLGVPRALAVLPRTRARRAAYLRRRRSGCGARWAAGWGCFLQQARAERRQRRLVRHPIDGDDGSLGDTSPRPQGPRWRGPPVCDRGRTAGGGHRARAAPAVEVRDARAASRVSTFAAPGSRAVCIESLAAVIDGVLVRAGGWQGCKARRRQRLPAGAPSAGGHREGNGKRWGLRLPGALSCAARGCQDRQRRSPRGHGDTERVSPRSVSPCPVSPCVSVLTSGQRSLGPLDLAGPWSGTSGRDRRPAPATTTPAARRPVARCR